MPKNRRYDPATKATLSEPRSVKKANSYQLKKKGLKCQIAYSTSLDLGIRGVRLQSATRRIQERNSNLCPRPRANLRFTWFSRTSWERRPSNALQIPGALSSRQQ